MAGKALAVLAVAAALGGAELAAQEARLTAAAYAARVAALDSAIVEGRSDALRLAREFADVTPPEGLDDEHGRFSVAAVRLVGAEGYQWRSSPRRSTAAAGGGCTMTPRTGWYTMADGSRNIDLDISCARDISIRGDADPAFVSARTGARAEYREALEQVDEGLEEAGVDLPETPSGYELRRERSIFTSVPRHRL